MVVEIPEPVLQQYRRFTLFNSLYTAHDSGHAIDLYPEEGAAPSPVSGTVEAIRHVQAPSKEYAAEEDAVIAVDTGEHLARILHVDPGIEEGDTVGLGDSLGKLVRSGFFAPWVPDHLHLGFRPHEADPFRASGSLPLELDVDSRPLAWDEVIVLANGIPVTGIALFCAREEFGIKLVGETVDVEIGERVTVDLRRE
jgi:hypothetical protein